MRQALKHKKKKVPKRGNANVKPKWREAWNQAIMKHEYSRKENECVPIDDSIDKGVPIDKEGSVIPKYVFHTWATKKLPTHMKKNLSLLKKKNPDFEFFLYDDEMCRDCIRTHFGLNEMNAFDTLIPGAYKADLWRYCVLYVYGGIYMDIKLQTIDPFQLKHLLYEEHFPRDIDCQGHKGIWQGLLVCKPGNPNLKLAIESICQHVRDYYYGPTDLSVTGPGLLYDIVHKQDKNVYERSKTKLDTMNIPTITNNVGIYFNDIPIMYFYKDYYIERESRVDNKLHYGESWKEKNIYHIYDNNWFKVVVSFTTSPDRIHKIKPMMESILNQTIKPDLFLLNIPKVFKRTNQAYTIPEFINDKVIVNVIDIDYGPATKIIPTIEYLKNNDYYFGKTRIIYVDDDISYSEKMIETFLQFSSNENHILCSSAMNITQDIKGRYSFIPQRTHGNKIHVVEGYGAVCLSPTIFKEDFASYFLTYIQDSSCFTSDDMILSNYYHKDKQNDLICINTKDFSVNNMWKNNCILDYGNLEDALHKQPTNNLSRYKVVMKLLENTQHIYIEPTKRN